MLFFKDWKIFVLLLLISQKTLYVISKVDCPELTFFEEYKSGLDQDNPNSRQVAVVMLDDRSILPVEGKSTYNFWQYAIAVNHAYTSAHGYYFTLFRPPNSSQCSESHDIKGTVGAKPVTVSTHWNKAAALLTVMRNSQLKCNDIILYIDSDAVVKRQDITPLDFLRKERKNNSELAKEYPWNASNIDNASIVVAAGDNGDMGVWMPWGFSVQWANTGVMLLRKSRATELLLEAWRDSTFRDDMTFYRQRWPFDQEAFNRLIYPPNRNMIALLPMVSMNSPKGHWISHIWGGEREKRETYLRQAAESLGLTDDKLRSTLENISIQHSEVLPQWIPNTQGNICKSK